ncbi:MAG: SipW-dependent-type signal peptide-containing protein [Chloroflexota bacterium]|nr:SipW-dependent-type signal peptide-containing protein [Chloroflexota bacterium]
METTSKKRKVLATLGVIALVAGLGTFAAFSATTSNTGNQITSGTVALNDSDGGTGKLSFIAGGTPGQVTTKCIRVTYTGSLAATVKLYRTGAIAAGANGKYSVAVERASTGTLTAPAADMNCTGPTAWASVLATTDLDLTPTTYAAGPDIKGSPFATSNAVDLRFTTTVKDGTVNGNTADNDTGTFEYTFEARSN